MIELINASKYFPTRFGRHYIFRNVSLRLPADANIGIIGPNGAGKSTLMRLLAGVDIPSEGRIVRTGRISWPLGLTPGMLGALTGRENARFVCRIYGMASDEITQSLEKIADVAGIGNYFDMPVNTFSSGMKSRLNFAISMAIDFDYYLFDEIGAPGDRAFKQISKAMVDQRLATSKFIMSSHSPEEILELCDSAILIGGGQLRYFEDVGAALSEYGEEVDPERRARRQRRREREAARANSPPLPETTADGTPAPGEGPTPRRSKKARSRKAMEASQPAGEFPSRQVSANASSAPHGAISAAEPEPLPAVESKKQRRRTSKESRPARIRTPSQPNFGAAPGDLDQAAGRASEGGAPGPETSDARQVTKQAARHRRDLTKERRLNARKSRRPGVETSAGLPDTPVAAPAKVTPPRALLLSERMRLEEEDRRRRQAHIALRQPERAADPDRTPTDGNDT